MAKYELTGETETFMGHTLHRIRALVEIASVGVAVGQLGGWIEQPANLAQVSGDAWVSGNARVYGNARVSGDAQVYGNARVYGDARVSGDAWVSGNARVYGNAQVYGSARVSGDAWVSGNARVYGNAQVYGSAQVYGGAWVCFTCTKTPIVLSGLRWTVTITDAHIQIGCQGHPIVKWEKFADRTIAAMDCRALEFWTAYKPTVMTLAATRS